jgi:hypothetical protein
VTNWTEEADSPLGFGGPSGASDLGTVCMNLAPPDEGSAEAYTRFYVFVPQGETFDPLDDDARVLSPFAILDDEKGDGPTEDDKKYVPNLCTPCHGGSAYTFNSHPNIGAQFREFDHSLMTLELGQAFDSGDLEDAFLFLNQSALSANASLGPVGQNLVTFLTEDLYPQSQNGVLRGQPTSAFDPGEELIPASWRTISDEDAAALGGDQARIDAYQRAKAGMWNDLVNPVCMTCHRMRKVEVNPSDYAFFKELGEEKNGVRALDGFMTGDPTDLEDHPPFMPHSQNLYERINGVTFDAQGNRRVRTYSPDNGNGGQDFPAPGARWDPTEGQAAVDALQTWYAALDNLRPATCEVQFRIHTDATQFGEEVFIVGEAVAFDNEKPAGERLLGGWVPWKGLQLSGATFPDWTGSIELPDGVEIQYKPVIVDERQGALNACGDDGNTLVRWANGDNRTFQVDCDGGKTVVDVDPLFQGPACQQ